MKDLGKEEVVKPVVFKLIKKRLAPATENNYYPGVKRIPSQDEVTDPNTGKKRIIRYSRSEQSIFKDEQPQKIVLDDIIFSNGALRVYEDNNTLLEFLRLCNWNRDNKNKVRGKEPLFYEHNPKQVAEEANQLMEAKIDAAYQAKTMEFDKLRAVARALKVNTGRSAQEIRHDVMVFAQDRPEDFLQALDNPQVRRRVEIQEAIELDLMRAEPKAILKVNANGNGEIACPVPVGIDPVDHAVKWTMTDPEGEAFMEEVQDTRKKLEENLDK